VPGGGLSADHRRWVEPPEPGFFLPGYALAARFRTRLVKALSAEEELKDPVPAGLKKKRWVVNVQPAGKGETALGYLAAYVHRTALGSQRILADDERGILFKYQDAESRQWQMLRLKPEEFLRRWLQHVLPRGFVRVRHYGWLSPAAKGRWATGPATAVVGTARTEARTPGAGAHVSEVWEADEPVGDLPAGAVTMKPDSNPPKARRVTLSGAGGRSDVVGRDRRREFRSRGRAAGAFHTSPNVYPRSRPAGWRGGPGLALPSKPSMRWVPGPKANRRGLSRRPVLF
jgi:hypothetical protein